MDCSTFAQRPCRCIASCCLWRQRFVIHFIVQALGTEYPGKELIEVFMKSIFIGLLVLSSAVVMIELVRSWKNYRLSDGKNAEAMIKTGHD